MRNRVTTVQNVTASVARTRTQVMRSNASLVVGSALGNGRAHALAVIW